MLPRGERLSSMQTLEDPLEALLLDSDLLLEGTDHEGVHNFDLTFQRRWSGTQDRTSAAWHQWTQVTTRLVRTLTWCNVKNNETHWTCRVDSGIPPVRWAAGTFLHVFTVICRHLRVAQCRAHQATLRGVVLNLPPVTSPVVGGDCCARELY